MKPNANPSPLRRKSRIRTAPQPRALHRTSAAAAAAQRVGSSRVKRSEHLAKVTFYYTGIDKII
jgi:hypothetical protein